MTVIAKRQQKIQHLRDLINHPRTGEAERDTAHRMLARILAKASTLDYEAAGITYADRRVYGAKYGQTRGLSLAQIAKLIRADIRLALKVAKATSAPGALTVHDPFAATPDGLKITVRTKTYSGGGSIDIVVRNIPDQWGWVKEIDLWGDMREVASPELKVLADELKAISDAYNYDGSDTMTDYFDVNFYGRVCTNEGRILA